MTVHARDRGAETWWKSFTTGKSAEKLGGVPHDTYGMTSLSVRQYVIGIYKQLGLQEKNITKVQTGGPGMSMTIGPVNVMLNRLSCRWRSRLKYVGPLRDTYFLILIFPTDEILLSSDKTIAIIDGSGVLADPIGINREELVRLAKLRVPVAYFDKSKLSKDGYLVKLEEQDVKLPCRSLPFA